jgi:putative heme iron utilization protein
MTVDGTKTRRYLRRQRYGVLSTLSKQLDGYPFGSIAQYVLDHAARPVMLISGRAEHTRNIDADPRVSLLVHEPVAAARSAARLTLVGDAARLSNDLDALHSRYLNYFPDAERLFALGDFAFYRIEPVTLRFIGGFGAIHWILAESYAPPANQLAEQELKIVADMNADHAHNLRAYCRHFKQVSTHDAVMVGIDCDGFDVRADGELLRFDFEQPVTAAASARRALAALAQRAA